MQEKIKQLGLLLKRPPKKLKNESLYLFANHVAILLDAGIPLLTCLRILSKQIDDKHLRDIIHDTIKQINQGQSLTLALSRHDKHFPKLFLSMVHAAEKSGDMAHVLSQLADYLRTQDKLEKKVKSAMSYPKFVLSFFAVVLVGIVFGLIPKFKDIFDSFGAKLPLPTEILISISNFAKSNFLLEVMFTVVAVIAIKKFKATEKGTDFFDKLLLKMPVIGEIVTKSMLSKFCRTLGVLINSGLSLVESLEIATTTANNIHYQVALKQVRKGVTAGGNISQLLKNYTIFPTLMTEMISVGETSGTLEKMLTKISDMYDDHVEAKVAGLSSVIEPILMVGLGAMALVVIIALYLPIFHMSGAIQ